LGDLEGPPFQIGGEVLDQKIDRSPLPHHACQVVARDRRGGGKEHRLNPAHPFPPAQLGRQVSQFAVQVRFRAILRHAHTP
jgi:hypothetical protein